ncbi:MAG: DUF6371 domain-containing protein, partial [Saprospiraceae bacterium]
MHYRYGAPSRFWEYRSGDGGLLGLICRFDTPDGKQIVPYTYRTDGARKEWRWQGFDLPRPLYNLHKIAERPDATVLVVEGEKAADAAQVLLPHIVVTCWQGGAMAIRNADWTPLYGKKVVLWPDKDTPGVKAMLNIADALRGNCAAIKWVNNVPELPEKWDIADADWTPEQALAYVRANIGNVPTKDAQEPGEAHTADADEAPPPQTQEFEYTPPPADFGAYDEPEQRDDPFRVLGFFKQEEQTVYAFFSELQHQVHIMKPSSLTAPNLLLLAPLDYWQTYFPKAKSKSFDVESAMNWIMRAGDAKGVYSPNNTRGRGAW